MKAGKSGMMREGDAKTEKGGDQEDGKAEFFFTVVALASSVC